MNPDSPKASNPNRLTIIDWSVNDRPREKYATQGAAALSNAELIAILLRTGNATENAVDLAKRILAKCNQQLNGLADLSLRQLTDIKGIGQAKATTLQAAFELGSRIRAEKVEISKHIYFTNDVVEIMQSKIAHLSHEEFWVIYMNQSSKILNISQIGKGGITATTVDIRLIIQEAILLESTAFIICHNHPSGSVTPSDTDIKLTRQIKDAANLFNIILLDHVILHKDQHFSFQEKEMI